MFTKKDKIILCHHNFADSDTSVASLHIAIAWKLLSVFRNLLSLVWWCYMWISLILYKSFFTPLLIFRQRKAVRRRMTWFVISLRSSWYKSQRGLTGIWSEGESNGNTSFSGTFSHLSGGFMNFSFDFEGIIKSSLSHIKA